MQSQPSVFELSLFDKFLLLALNQCLISETCPLISELSIFLSSVGFSLLCSIFGNQMKHSFFLFDISGH